jgi:endoglucanase
MRILTFFILLHFFVHGKNLRGKNIFDPEVVRGTNWFGFETEASDLQCIWAHDLDWHLNRMKDVGFNYIRLPFSLEYVQKGNWEKMDAFFEKAKEHNFKVVLDCHRLFNSRQSPKPYNSVYSFSDFLDGWKTILERYKNFDNLTHVDIFNEFQTGNYEEWNDLATRTLLFIENSFPERFEYMVGGINWGGNLRNVNVNVPFLDRVTYSIHKYSFSDTPPYVEKWNYSFGKHSKKNVGEWGYMSEIKSQSEWANDFATYLVDKDIRDTFFWTWTQNSYDTKGILTDCTNVDYQKILLLHNLWS